MHQVLAYEYVKDIVARRPPFRDEHLAHIRAEQDAGRVVMAGAIGDPPSGALIVFRDTDRAAIEKFVGDDPYVGAGLVTHWRIEPWQVV
jgi:uncharacterized protein YciI